SGRFRPPPSDCSAWPPDMHEVAESRHAALRLTETMKMGLAPPMLEAGRPPERGRTVLVPEPVGKSGPTSPRTRDCRRRATRRARRADCLLQALSPEGGHLSGGSSMDTLYPHCAGLDVHKDTVVACVRHHAGAARPQQEVRTFATHTQGLI